MMRERTNGEHTSAWPHQIALVPGPAVDGDGATERLDAQQRPSSSQEPDMSRLNSPRARPVVDSARRWTEN